MHILITRPEPGASEFAEQVRKNNLEPVVLPILTYEEVAADYSDVEHFDTWVFTSAEAVRVFSKHVQARNTPTFTVGDKTADVAQNLGFSNVQSADGAIDDLLAILPKEANVLHFCSADTPQNDLTQKIIYRATLAHPDIASVFAQHPVKGIALFSPRSAAHLIKLLKNNNLDKDTPSIDVFCLSENVKHAVQNIPWKSIRVANRPNAVAMLELLTHW